LGHERSRDQRLQLPVIGRAIAYDGATCTAPTLPWKGRAIACGLRDRHGLHSALVLRSPHASCVRASRRMGAARLVPRPMLRDASQQALRCSSARGRTEGAATCDCPAWKGRVAPSVWRHQMRWPWAAAGAFLQVRKRQTLIQRVSSQAPVLIGISREVDAAFDRHDVQARTVPGCEACECGLSLIVHLAEGVLFVHA
jgi:hypothetical protein